MSEQSIISELLAEIKELRNESDSSQMDVHSLSHFTFEELQDKIKISGILIAPGIWNGVVYSPEELKKMYEREKDTLINMPIKVEHEKDPEYGPKTVGKIDNVNWDDTIKSIVYEATITDPKAIEDVKNKRFTATSLKSSMIRVLERGTPKGKDIKPIDNSLTEYPACAPCVITYFQELSSGSSSKSFFGIYPSDSIQKLLTKNELCKVEETMSETNDPLVYVLPDENELNDQPEIEIELESMPLSKAILENKRIFKYAKPDGSKEKVKRKTGYYYYPYYEYPYPYYYEYPYPYYYPYYYPSPKQRKTKKLTEDDLTIDDIEILSEYKVIKNKKTGKYTVFKVPSDGGLWKIVKSFDTKEEADKYIEGLSDLASEYKIKKLDNGKFGVFDKDDKLLKEFDTEEEAKKYVNDLEKKEGKEEYPSVEEESTKEEKKESIEENTSVQPVQSVVQPSEQVPVKEEHIESPKEEIKPVEQPEVQPKEEIKEEPKIEFDIDQIIDETSKSLDKVAELIIFGEKKRR